MIPNSSDRRTDVSARGETLRRALLALVVLAAEPAFAASAWQPLGPWGGAVHALAVDRSSRSLLAATDVGVYRSPMTVTAWTPLPTLPHPQPVLAVAACGGRVWAATGASVVRLATDSWVDETAGIGDSLPASVVQLLCGEGTTVYLRRDLALLRHSGAPGTPWRTLRGRGVRGVAVDPVAGRRIVVVEGRDVLWSENAGARWQRRSRGRLATDESMVRPLAVAPGGGALYVGGAALQRSLDGGRSFATVPTTGRTTALAVRPDRPRAAWAATGGGVLRSSDRGRTWRRAAVPTFIDGFTSLVANGGTLWAGRRGVPKYDPPLHTVFRSGDDGRSWQLATTGISGVALSSVTVASLGPPRVYAFAHWLGTLRLSGGAWSGGSGWAGPPLRLAADPFVPDALLAATGLYATLGHSADGGLTWDLADHDALCGVATLDFDPAIPGRAWAASLCALARSDDHGATWTRVSSLAVGGATLTGLRLSGADPDRLWVFGTRKAEAPNPVWTSADGGATWSESRLARVVDLAPDPFDPRGAWAIAGSYTGATRIVRTSDAGATWTEVILFAEPLAQLVADPSTPGTLYARRYNGAAIPKVLRSLDGGATWHPFARGIPAGAPLERLLMHPESGSIVAWGTSIWVLAGPP